LGLIALGILLLGAQLVLYLGTKNVYPPPGIGERHIEPPPQVRTTPLPGVFGAVSLIAGIVLILKRSDEPDDARDGVSVPETAAGQLRERRR
jgi:hypothetical protein